MNDRQAPFPPGPNVGTQLRVLRAKKMREDRKREAEADANAVVDKHQRGARTSAQLTLPSADAGLPRTAGSRFEFQREVWRHIAEGRSGLLHATTGSGKTYAVWFALLNRALAGEVRGWRRCACCG